jgi:hypothetical protein
MRQILLCADQAVAHFQEDISGFPVSGGAPPEQSSNLPNELRTGFDRFSHLDALFEIKVHEYQAHNDRFEWYPPAYEAKHHRSATVSGNRGP